MKKNLFRAAAAVALSAALLSLAGCQTAAKQAVQELDVQDAVTIQLVCQSEDVYQIFYSTYLEGEEYGQGGWADMDGKALTSETSLTASFDKDYFDGKDLSTLSMDFSLRRRGHCGACHHGAGGHPREVRRDLHHPLHRG